MEFTNKWLLGKAKTLLGTLGCNGTDHISFNKLFVVKLSNIVMLNNKKKYLFLSDMEPKIINDKGHKSEIKENKLYINGIIYFRIVIITMMIYSSFLRYCTL